MSSSRIIATRKRDVYMTHICSDCGFPIVAVVHIEAKAEKTYTFSRSKAEQIASETADNAIESEIRRIESCKITKHALVGKIKGSSMISPGHFCESSFSNHETACPYCSNVEPWKSTSVLSRKNIDELKPENFPIVYKSAEEAVSWAKEIIGQMLVKITEQIKDRAIREQAVLDSVKTKKQILSWEEQLRTIPEVKMRDSINLELNELKTRKANIGLLDIKGKNEVNSRIKALELKLNDINKVINEIESPIKDNISKADKNLLHTQAIAFGCESIVNKNLNNAVCFHFKPNEIPQEFLIDDPVQSSVNKGIDIPNTGNDVPDEQKSPMADDVIFCRKCGFKLLPDSGFCSKCGTKVK